MSSSLCKTSVKVKGTEENVSVIELALAVLNDEETFITGEGGRSSKDEGGGSFSPAVGDHGNRRQHGKDSETD